MIPGCQANSRAAATLLVALLTSAGCERGPKPIRYGRDECAECRMTLVDLHYGAEFISARGKVFFFDDLNCLTAYQRRTDRAPNSAAQAVVVHFNHPGRLLDVKQAWFLRHDGLRSPMASGLAAFATEAEAEAVRRQLGGGGHLLRWAGVLAIPP